MSGEVLGTGGNNISRLDRDNSAVGVGNETSIGMGNLGSVDLSGVSGDNSAVSVGNQTVGESNSSVWVVSKASGDDMSEVSEVSSLGEGNGGGVSGHHGAVGVGHQASGGDSNAGSKNQKLHVENVCCASV